MGTSPVAVAALPGDRWVTADRLSDTLTFVDATGERPRVAATVSVGAPARASAAELGEVLFYGRALTPRNVADGPLSLYTCAACHDDGHVDGRRHPSKRDRFHSMTKTCRGLGTTAPYLSLGEPATIEAFADNIVATHAQGADRAPDDYDRYPVTLRLRAHDRDRDKEGWRARTLPPDEVRVALAAYMARIPPEPSPFVAPGRRALTAEERRGLALFRDGCAGCHELVGDTTRGNRVPARELERRLLAGQVALTSARLYDVGTPVLGKTGNNPPSLRGVWDAAPYFSDGSARTLEDVLRRTDPAAGCTRQPTPSGLPRGPRSSGGVAGVPARALGSRAGAGYQPPPAGAAPLSPLSAFLSVFLSFLAGLSDLSPAGGLSSALTGREIRNEPARIVARINFMEVSLLRLTCKPL